MVRMLRPLPDPQADVKPEKPLHYLLLGDLQLLSPPDALDPLVPARQICIANRLPVGRITCQPMLFRGPWSIGRLDRWRINVSFSTGLSRFPAML